MHANKQPSIPLIPAPNNGPAFSMPAIHGPGSQQQQQQQQQPQLQLINQQNIIPT